MHSGSSAELSQVALDSLQQGVDGLRDRARQDLPEHELTRLLRAAASLRTQLDSVFTELVGALDRRISRRQPDGDPAISCATWLRDELRVTSSAAWGQVRLARQLQDLPDTAKAFASGQLSVHHAISITRTVDRVLLGGGRPEDAERLLLAEAGSRTASELLLWGRHLRHRLNPQELADEEEEQHRRRWLSLNRTWDGTYSIEGNLDAEGGTVLRTALQGLLGPRARGDERSPGQRRADALVELGRRSLDSGELPRRGGVKPHITITASLGTLRGDPGSPAATLDWGLPISGEALRRIACDAELTPILVSRNGDPLHVGRAHRTATPRMRKALALRDQRCAWPGCDRPPEQCEGNHQDLWADGGQTDLEYMEILCAAHHRKFHAGYRLLRHPDGRVEEVFGPGIHAPPAA